MKTKLFSGKLYKEALRQLRLPGISLFAILFLTSILIPLGYLLRGNYSFNPEYVVRIRVAEFAPLITGYMYIAPFLLTIFLFGFLNKRNKSDFYHALPHDRFSVFLSLFAAIVTYLYLTIITTVLTCGLLYSMADVVFQPSTMVYVSLANMAGATLVGGATAIGMCLTGTFITNASVMMLTLFLPRLLTTFVMGFTSTLVEVIPEMGTGLLGNLAYNIPANVIMGAVFNNNHSYSEALSFVGGIIYTFLLALLYIGIAAVLFKRRKSETAEKSSPSTILQHTYRCLVTLPFAIGITGTLIISGDPIQDLKENTILYITFVVICLIIYYLYEIITTKKWRNLIKATPVLLVLIGLNVLFAIIVYANKNYTLSFSPNANQIEWVELENKSYGYQYTAYDYSNHSYGTKVIENIRFQENEIKNIIAEALDTSIGSVKNNSFHRYEYQFTFKIKSKGNLTKTRKLVFNVDQSSKLQNALLENEEYFNAITKLPEDEYIDHKYISFLDSNYNEGFDYPDELYRIFKEEYQELSPDRQKLIANRNLNYYTGYYNQTNHDKYYYAGEIPATIVIEGSYEDSYFTNSYMITNLTPQSYEYFLTKVMDKSKDNAVEMIDTWLRMESGNVTFIYRAHEDFPMTVQPKLVINLNNQLDELEKDNLDTILKTIRSSSERKLSVEESVYSFATEDIYTGNRGIIYFNLSPIELNKIEEAASRLYSSKR